MYAGWDGFPSHFLPIVSQNEKLRAYHNLLRECTKENMAISWWKYLQMQLTQPVNSQSKKCKQKSSIRLILNHVNGDILSHSY